MVQIPEFLLIVYKCIKRRYAAQAAQNLSENDPVLHHHRRNDTAVHEYHVGDVQRIPDSMIGGNTTSKKVLYIMKHQKGSIL